MFCSHCGHQVQGKFCSNCGSPLESSLLAPRGDIASRSEAPTVDWRTETRYEVLLQVPEVRQRLAEAAKAATKRLSGEDFLELCEKVFSPIEGVSLAKIATLIAPIYARLGIRTGKRRADLVAQPIGVTTVAVLCSLARHGQSLRNVRQGEDGCIIEAAIPSDMWSFEGNLLVSIAARPNGTWVEAGTTIGGQLFDWGKSSRCLQKLFADMQPATLAKSA